MLWRLAIHLQSGLMSCFECLFHKMFCFAAVADVCSRQLRQQVLQHRAASCLCSKLAEQAMPCRTGSDVK